MKKLLLSGLLINAFLCGALRAQPCEVLMEKHAPSNLDEHVFASINHWGEHAPWLDGPMVFITNTAFSPVAGIPVALFTIGHINDDRELALAGFTTAMGLASSGLVGEVLLKNIIKRKRPYHVIEGTRLITEGAHGYSFPSGHTSSTFGLATGLSLHFPKWYVIGPSFLYATIVALSRPYLGAHYPSDLIAGAVLGVGFQFLWYEFEKSYKDKWKLFPSGEPVPASSIIAIKLPI